MFIFSFCPVHISIITDHKSQPLNSKMAALKVVCWHIKKSQNSFHTLYHDVTKQKFHYNLVQIRSMGNCNKLNYFSIPEHSLPALVSSLMIKILIQEFLFTLQPTNVGVCTNT